MVEAWKAVMTQAHETSSTQRQETVVLLGGDSPPSEAGQCSQETYGPGLYCQHAVLYKVRLPLWTGTV